MERKKGKIKAGCVKILWTLMVVFLCALPCLALDVLVGETLYLDYAITGDWLQVYGGGTANLYPGAHVDGGIIAKAGSTVNIYAGTLGPGQSVTLTGSPYATVTVYGTDFAVTSGTIEPDGSWIPGYAYGGTLTGFYGNGEPIELKFHSNGAINLVDIGSPGPEPITIDIKPGSYPNAINLGSNGVVPVAILSTPDFDAATVDPDTVFLAGSSVAVRGKGNKSLASVEDVNGDGLLDLVVKVETENLDPGTFQDGLAILQIIVDNTVIYEGSDEIIIVPPE